MMGPKQEAQAALFYEFSLEDHVPQDHLLRSIDRFVDLSSIRSHLADWGSPGLMDTFSLMKESVFHAENKELVRDGI